jgi:hypothetical protein
MGAGYTIYPRLSASVTSLVVEPLRRTSLQGQILRIDERRKTKVERHLFRETAASFESHALRL